MMGFLSGRVTCLRFRPTTASPRMFSMEHLEMLKSSAHGAQRTAAPDGLVVGWTAGDHILDTRFLLEKNIVNDCLHFALRIDTQKLPSDLLRAYMEVELCAVADKNPSGRPTMRQRKEARQAAQDRLEAEAHDGRFIRRKSFPVLWDAQSGEVLVGTTSATSLDHFLPLFRKTFSTDLDFLGAGRQAFLQAEARQQSRRADDAKLSPFVPGMTIEEVAWAPEENNIDFLGNEFLLWLWYVLDNESDSIALADGSEATVMIVRSLTLECPKGQTGRQTISSDAPARLPEAKRAIQVGKLPRKAGLIIVRHDQQYELTLQGETLAVNSAKLPAVEGENDQSRREERINQIRHMLETLDLLYDAFGNHRLGAGWSKELANIQAWLNKPDRRRTVSAS